MTVTLVSKHGIRGNDEVWLTFPKWDTSSSKSFLKDDKCTVLQTSSRAKCVVDGDIVKVINAFAFSNPVEAGVPAVLSIEAVRNAGSLRGVNSIKV